MTSKKEKMIIIDGNALIHRSFHALPPTMTTKKGEMVNAVYGFATVLLKALKEFRPDYVVLTLDKAGPTFRHIEYKDYKATRVKAPDDLYTQIPRVKELAEAFAIPVFAEAGFEADDLIGTITARVDGDIEKIIVTGDMDTLQLVDDNTKVYTMSRGLSDSILYDARTVKARFSLKPEQMIDYKALRGDPSDNIPGVKGIGEKTASELLIEFKTLDGVYKNINSAKIKDRIRELLKEHKKDALMSKSLATIKRDVKIKFNLDDARFGNIKQEEVVKLFSDLEFKSLLPRVHSLFSGSAKTLPAPPFQKGRGREKGGEIFDKFERNKKEFKYILVDDEKKFLDFLSKLKKQSRFVFDTETDSFDPLIANLLGISFSWKDGEAYFVSVVKKTRSFASAQDDKQNTLFNFNKKEENKIHPWLENLRSIFENPKIEKYGHNIKFDYRVMKSSGINVANVAFDTMIASYLLNPGTRQHNLDAVTFTELGFEKISKEDLLGKGRDKKNFNEVEAEKLSLYSCEDADFTRRLVNALSKQLREQKMEKLFYEIEMPLVTVLADMEDKGVLLDKNVLVELSREIDKRIKTLEKKIYKLAGIEFNIKSTQQLREILFEKLEISSLNIGKNKTGFSTAADELDKLKDAHPIIRLVQEYRELAKLSSTYADALPDLISKKDGRLHTSFNQTITATGRLSSTEPNLQNIPVRTELGNEIRKAFVACSGCKLLSLDYSQIELRLAAHMSGDKKMIEAFKKGEDIHIATAAAINGVKLEEVTKEMRREAKATNFGILYGQGPHGLSQTADISYDRAREFIANYFKAYQGIKKWVEEVVDEARENGYSETLFGRRRYLPEINSSVVMVKKAAERMAINTPLQGTAADMIKIAMIEIEKMIKKEYKTEDVKMILQVHDELLFEIKSAKVQELSEKIKKIMEEVLKLKVPVVVDANTGDSWGELK
ncbi:MAG: DNA polymerase I [Parcubacteria group bacterium ADurb.Bin316]|nr:MAG: DNA polymerase I [Parcubacteria group bacterium ADurb.Bin316]HOZ55678.1 DNA polymerase I [bacterium]